MSKTDKSHHTLFIPFHSQRQLFLLNFENEYIRRKVSINILFYDTECKIPRDFTNSSWRRDNDEHKRGLTAGTFSLEIN